MRPSCFNKPSQANYKIVLKFSALSVVIATLSGCGENAKDCGGRWDNIFGREECAVPQPTSQNVSKTSQTISNLALPNPFIVGQNHTLAATSSSGLAVTYSSKTADVCSVTGTQIKALTVGTCTVEANQAGDDKTLAAATVSVSTETGCTVPQILSEDKKSCITPNNLKIGEFIDSAVQGLSYKTPTYAGITDQNGKFYYVEGEDVSFKISALELGTVVASSRVHVSDLASSSYNKKNNKDVKIAQLLQALDEDKNPDNGIVLNDKVQQFFTSEKNIDFLLDNDAFTQLLKEKLAPLNAVVPSQEVVKKHIASSLEYVAQGDCSVPFGKFVSIDNSTLTNEKLTCYGKTKFQAYLTQTVPKYDELIAEVINPNHIDRISQTASREAAQKSFIADSLNATVALIKTVDAANQGKVVEAFARLTEYVLKLSLTVNPNQTTEKAAAGANAIIESLLNAPKCITLVSALSIEAEAALACVDTFRATLEIPQGDESLFTKIKPQLTIIVDALKTVKSLTEVGEKGQAAIAAAVASALSANIGILRLTTTESGSVANQMLEELATSIITPTLNVVSCYPNVAAVGSVKLNPIGLMADCADNVVRLTAENVEVIGRRLYGISALKILNSRAQALAIEKFALAEIVSVSSYSDMYKKWGIPLDTPYEQGVNLLLKKLIDKILEDNGWWSNLFSDEDVLLHSYRSDMVSDINRELLKIDVVASQIMSSRDIVFRSIKNNGGLVTAEIDFFVSNVNGGRKVCFSQGSDHDNNNPYMIEPTNEGYDRRSLTFGYATSGAATINCFVYNKLGQFLYRQGAPVFIDDVDYRIERLPQNTTIRQGDRIHVSLVGESGIKPRLIRWNFGDGTAEYISTPNDYSVPHVYLTSGSKQIDAYVLDVYNNVIKLSQTINIEPSTEQKIVYTNFNPQTLRFGQLGEIVLQGINLTEDLQLSCESCVDGVRENLAKSNSRQRVYVYVPRATDMTKAMNDTLVVKKIDGTVLAQANIPIMPVFDTVTPSSREAVVNSEITFSLSTPLDYIKSVVWSIGETVVQTLNSIAEVFKHIFSTVGEFVISAELKDKNGDVVSHAETIVSIKSLTCSAGQIIENGKCVDIATLANGEANIALYGDVKKEMISTVKIDDGRTALLVDDVTAIYAAFGLDTRGKGLQDYVNTHINAVISMLKTNGATVNTLVNKPTRNAQGLAHNVVLDADFDSVVKSPADLRKLLLEYFNNKVLSTQLLNVVSTPSTKLRVTLSFWESNGNVFVWASVFPIDKSETVLQLYGDLNSTAAVTTAIKLQSQNNQQDFTQQAANLSGVDILWNVDNSGSMQQEQTNLANGAANFFSKLKATGIDYRLAVNTTDGRQCSLRKLTDGTNRFISSSTLNGENEWSILSRPGTNGSGTETAFYCVRELLEGVGSLAQDKAEFDRPNAKNLVVFVTDEPEIETYQNSKPTGSPSSYVARTFNDYKNFFVSSGATFFSIIEPNSTIVREDFTVSRPLVENCNGQGGSASGGAHFKEISKLTGGSSSSICADADSWSVMFDEVVRAATGLASNFKLSHVPIPSTIKVLVNGRSVLRDTNHAQGFDVVFSDSGAALAFYGNDIPIQNSIIQVEYRYLLN